MNRSSRNAKFIPKHLYQQKNEPKELRSSIQEMSLNLLNDIDRRYESQSYDPQREKEITKSSTSKSFSSNQINWKPQSKTQQTSQNSQQQFQGSNSFVQSTHSQPSERKYSNQKHKQFNKSQEIQQGYQRFKENHSSKRQSIVDKENIHINTGQKGEDDINHIITCLEQRFISSGQKNKSILGLKKPQLNTIEDQLRQNVQILNNRDASFRLDISKVKKQNSDLNDKYNEAIKQIVELEKLKKRVIDSLNYQDNEYIIRMDNNMMQMKQKLTHLLGQKNGEQDKINAMTQQIYEIQQENLYLKSLLEQHNESKQQNGKKQNKLQFMPTKTNTMAFNNNYQDMRIQPEQRDFLLQKNQQYKLKMSTFQSTESDVENSYISQLHEDQDQQDSQMLNGIIQDVQQGGKKLNNTQIYEKLMQGILAKNEQVNNPQNYLEQYEITNDSNEYKQSNRFIEKRPSDLPIFKCGSQMSNFSFVQNSERKHSQAELNKFNPSVDNHMIHQILNLNEQLTKQISLSKLSKDQANQFINYLQDQITNTSSQGPSDHVESQYKNQQLTEGDVDDIGIINGQQEELIPSYNRAPQ